MCTSQVTGTTLGVIGYGDIGQAAARKAKAMGMRIVAQRRRPELSQGDGVADEVLGADQVQEGDNRFSIVGESGRLVLMLLLSLLLVVVVLLFERKSKQNQRKTT